VATSTQIANLALAHLGEREISDIAGTAVNETRCALFYPQARDSLLREHDWNFATKRATLTATTVDVTDVTQWAYGYQKPSDCVKIIAVYPDGADSDTGASAFTPFPSTSLYLPDCVYYTQADFVLETIYNGSAYEDIIFTNAEDATVKYTYLPDVAKFPVHFIDALAYRMAAYLAGPILKGKEGRAVAREMLELYGVFLAKAKEFDASNRSVRVEPYNATIAAR